MGRLVRNKYTSEVAEDGDALKTGYTCYSRRPASAAPGSGFLEPSDAESYDDMTDMMAAFGGRDSAIRRRWHEEDDYNN